MFKRSFFFLACVFLFMSICNAWGSPLSLKNGGKVFVHAIGGNGIKVHTYMSTYEVAANASHIIELKNQLVVVDMQFVKRFAEEFRAYAESLKKPIDRVYLSHEHPDHWMGYIAFQDINVYALPETIAYLRKSGEAILKAKNKPGRVPSRAVPVQHGSLKIDDVTFKFLQIKNTESENALIIAIPELKTLIAQDLLYNGVHLYLGHDCHTTWQKELKRLKSQFSDYQYFLCGHGAPVSRTAIFDNNIEYLEQAKTAFSSSDKDPKKIETALIERYPQLKCRYFVPLGIKMALKKPNEHR